MVQGDNGDEGFCSGELKSSSFLWSCGGDNDGGDECLGLCVLSPVSGGEWAPEGDDIGGGDSLLHFSFSLVGNVNLATLFFSPSSVLLVEDFEKLPSSLVTDDGFVSSCSSVLLPLLTDDKDSVLRLSCSASPVENSTIPFSCVVANTFISSSQPDDLFFSLCVCLSAFLTCSL